ncbi:WhiB family transcriptional regulator, redox-sensing transcriptional regulator [Blastococcus sp. DSM 46786]|nr:WhiB family transcriptional regulator [Blastococcus sp. DSM 46786]SEM17120.1 WhiB family transcriptional regulator, redox-sensing transcriptional regulator [Blastococcus sp. DSM 46786]
MPSLSRPVLTLVPGSATEAEHRAPVDAFTAFPPLDAAAWPAPVESDDSWRLDALCAETDPEAFFPEKGGSTRDAKRVCTGCPVRAECLEFALANDERFGIWGGLSERERRRVRLQRRDIISA